MSHTRRTLLLDGTSWDLTLDGVGRIVLADGDAATAQNVANEARLFTEDAYFLQDRGIPYFLIGLGRRANATVLRSYLRRAALQVPDVKEVSSVQIISFDPSARTLTGDVQFTTFGRSSGAPMSARVSITDAPSSRKRSPQLASAGGFKEGEDAHG